MIPSPPRSAGESSRLRCPAGGTRQLGGGRALRNDPRIWGPGLRGHLGLVGSVQLPGQPSPGAKFGIAKGLLAAGETCTAGALCGMTRRRRAGPPDPLIGAGRFRRDRAFCADEIFLPSPQMVCGRAAHRGQRLGLGLLGETLAASAPISEHSGGNPLFAKRLIPAGRISVAGPNFRIRARVTVAGGVANDTFSDPLPTGFPHGTLLGSTPEVDVTNGAGDIGLLDLEVLFRGVGLAGVMHSVGIGASPGQSRRDRRERQTTGTAVAAAVDDGGPLRCDLRPVERRQHGQRGQPRHPVRRDPRLIDPVGSPPNRFPTDSQPPEQGKHLTRWARSRRGFHFEVNDAVSFQSTSRQRPPTDYAVSFRPDLKGTCGADPPSQDRLEALQPDPSDR